MIGDELKALRNQAGMTVRAVASELGYEVHSKYSYYESNRFKGPLPMKLARRLADMWERLGVNRLDIMVLAGLTYDQAVRERTSAIALKHQSTVLMEVIFPERPALFAMLKRMFELIEYDGVPEEVLHKIAFVLPYALRNTPNGKVDPYHNFELGSQFDEVLEASLERWRIARDVDWPV